jgi:hypothetical protein
LSPWADEFRKLRKLTGGGAASAAWMRAPVIVWEEKQLALSAHQSAG